MPSSITSNLRLPVRMFVLSASKLKERNNAHTHTHKINRPPPGLGFVTTIRAVRDEDNVERKNSEEKEMGEEGEEEMIENIRTVQLDTNGDGTSPTSQENSHKHHNKTQTSTTKIKGTIDCVGYFLDTSSDTPDYYGLVNENGDVDSLIPSDEFLREHGEIETLIQSHDYEFEFEAMNPLRSFNSLADSKLRRPTLRPIYQNQSC